MKAIRYGPAREPRLLMNWAKVRFRAYLPSVTSRRSGFPATSRQVMPTPMTVKASSRWL